MTNATTTSGRLPELLREIEPNRCIELLEAVSHGRLATVDAGEPLLVVTNHLVDAGDIYVRTRSDSQLARLTENGRVVRAVYEVDSAFPAGRSGWSVIARGGLMREFGETRAAHLRSRLTAWAEGDRDVVLRLEVQQLTGRAVGGPTHQHQDQDQG
jgi:nitroimidazol reductase NimA-like FMN-containing flavoprotein (pyridoxamine 5'-phosphate oxidase superfamily)